MGIVKSKNKLVVEPSLFEKNRKRRKESNKEQLSQQGL